jgi:hypothetical protein
MKLIDENLKEIFKAHGINDFMSAYAYLKTTECYSDLECLVNSLNHFEINSNDYDYIRIVEINDNVCTFQVCKLADGYTKIKDYIIHCAERMVVHHELYDVIFEIKDVSEVDYTFIFKDFSGITEKLLYKDFDEAVQSQRQEMVVEMVEDDDINETTWGTDLPRYGERTPLESPNDIPSVDELRVDNSLYATFDEVTGEVELSWGDVENASNQTEIDLPSGLSVNAYRMFRRGY